MTRKDRFGPGPRLADPRNFSYFGGLRRPGVTFSPWRHGFDSRWDHHNSGHLARPASRGSRIAKRIAKESRRSRGESGSLSLPSSVRKTSSFSDRAAGLGRRVDPFLAQALAVKLHHPDALLLHVAEGLGLEGDAVPVCLRRRKILLHKQDRIRIYMRQHIDPEVAPKFQIANSQRQSHKPGLYHAHRPPGKMC